MNIAIALNGSNSINLNLLSDQLNIDNWIASDGGYNTLQRYNIIPEIVIGDMDSINNVEEVEQVVYPSNKDASDGYLALKYCLEHYKEVEHIYIVGVIDDKRLEHFWNNIISLFDNKVVIITNNNLICYTDKDIKLEYIVNCDYISLFSLTDVSNLSIIGAKYEVNKQNYQANRFLGLSNEFVDEQPITVSLDSGQLVIFYSFKE